jgi:hypothetical protein
MRFSYLVASEAFSSTYRTYGHPRVAKNHPQLHPLKPIQNGGGSCDATAPPDAALPESCGGGSRGACHAGKRTCQCLGNWTGPHCLNPTGYDDVIWDPPDTLSDLGFSWPSLGGGGAGTGMIIVCAMAATTLLAPVALRRGRRRREGYARVKSAERQAAAASAAAAYERRAVA